MNVAATFETEPRLVVSPYARRLARERDIALEVLAGSGPNNRIVAADVLAYRVPVAEAPTEQTEIRIATSTFAFSATVSLAGFYRLVEDLARVGLTVEIEDIALRAARTAFASMDHEGDRDDTGIAVEARGRQILLSTASNLSIGVERNLRLEALETGADVSSERAILSLSVMRARRAVPVSMSPLPGRDIRLVLVVNEEREEGSVLLCSNAEATTENEAVELLEGFVDAVEMPLALMA